MNRFIVYIAVCFLSIFTGSLLFCDTTVAIEANNSGISSQTTQDLLDIRLISISPTENLFEWFGHTAIEVRNLQSGDSFSFSFGGFTFGREDLLMFSMGKFRFWNYFKESDAYLRHHRKAGRHIVFQSLNMTIPQKQKLVSLLLEATAPENRYYMYDHFQDNCATRIRDLVDKTLGGSLRKQTSFNDGYTHRQYINRMTAHQPGLNFILNFILSDGVDKPIQVWDTMFLPDRLMAVFQNVSTTPPRAGLILPLVKNRTEIIGKEKSAFFNTDVVIPQTATREYIVGLVLFLIFGLSAGFYLKGNKVARFIYSGLVSAYGLVFGLLVLILFLMSSIANHEDTYWNENFFLVNPLTIALVPLGILHIFGKGERLFLCVSIVCCLSGIVAVAVKLFPIFDQVNGQQLRMLLPVIIVMGFTGGVRLAKRQID